MIVETTEIPGVLLLQAMRHGDERGFLSETFKASTLASHGVSHTWVQDNHSRWENRGVMRGLHFQAPPRAQAKLVRVIRGTILDVVVDIRRGAPTFGRHIAVELSDKNWRQLFAPIGFAHGFITLSEGAEVLYKTSDEYAPETEGGLNWLDPELAIEWPISPELATVNQRDKNWPALANLATPFEWVQP